MTAGVASRGLAHGFANGGTLRVVAFPGALRVTLNFNKLREGWSLALFLMLR